MTIFKNFIKILFRGYKIPIIIYVVIFALISIIASQNINSKVDNAFDISRCRVTIIDNDNSKLSNSLIDYLKENANVVELNKNELENVKDAVFFRKVSCVLTIKKGFEQGYLKGNDGLIDKLCLPDDTSVHMLETQVNKYLNFVKMYTNNNYNIDDAIKASENSLKQNVKVAIFSEKKEHMDSFIYYFIYLPYPIIAILTMSLSAVLVYFNTIETKRRNLISPVSLVSYNSQLILGSLVVPLIIFCGFTIVALILYGTCIFSVEGLIVLLNLFILCIVCLSLSFLISNIATKKAISAITTILSLGCCFFGGVFVPLNMLGEGVRKVAMLNPIYWYTKTNYLIGETINVNTKVISECLKYMSVQILFAVAFFSISLIVIKQRRTQEN